MLKIIAEVYMPVGNNPFGSLVGKWELDHDDPAERRVLGIRCRDAFEAGLSVRTYPATPA